MKSIGILIIPVLILGIAAGILTAKNRKKTYDHDERQLMAQGRAYMWGFLTVAGYTLLYPFVTLAAGRELMETSVALFLGILLGLTVFTVYCIWKDAYIGVHARSAGTLVSVALVSFSQGLYGFMNASYGNLVVDGKLSLPAVSLGIFALGVIILGTYALKKALSRREEDE